MWLEIMIFYSFDAKYVDDSGARLDMPARLGDETRRQIQDIAVQAYKNPLLRRFCTSGYVFKG